MGRRLHPCGGSQEALIAVSQMPRPTLLRRLVPSSLAGQIILVVAIALFVAQAINFTLLLRERERQRLTVATAPAVARSEEHTSELQSLMRISYAVFCLKNTIHKN